jgi:small subunit ribosomal protein S8
MSDTISDMLTRIRNAGRALLPVVTMPHSRMKESIARILKDQGYVADVSIEGETARKTIKIKLKFEGKRCVIEGLKRISKPGLRRYAGTSDIPRVRGGLGITVISTSQGVMSGAEARKKNLGGEMLCQIW